MNEEFKNLCNVTLYNTLQFNKTDTLMFSSISERDEYFDSIIDQETLEEFTDLYEGRTIVLPMSYLDCKKYNTMKLHYEDSLGHITDYYCNVDNYQYVSEEACTPIYRIDYFLTYGHLLYNKNIDMITDRRTVKESNVTQYMKADEMSVPKLSYSQTSTSGRTLSHCYIIFLNKTAGTVGKKGVTTKMMYQIGNDSNNQPVSMLLDTHTIGSYVLVTNDTTFASRLAVEPTEYVEKIIECDINPMDFMEEVDYNSYTTNGYAYITTDIVKYCNSAVRMGIGEDIKKIINRLPYYGMVVQGNEYDINEFSESDRPKKDNVTTYYFYENLLFFNNFGYSFCFPLGYKGEAVSYEYMCSWQSGKNFSYTSDYVNSLAYKEIVESNSQLLTYTEKNSSLNLNYNNSITNNSNQQLDITKKQSNLSYESQINSTRTDIKNTETQTMGGLMGSILSAGACAMTGDYVGAIKALFGQGVAIKTNLNNIEMLSYQVGTLNQQKALQSDLVDLQKKANNVNNNFQCDTIAMARDNAVANISISTKYNNAKPNAYNPTDYTKYTSYYYIFGIDNKKGTDYTQYENIVNHYNVNGISIGYLENWKPNVYEGLYFDYIKGSVIDNSNTLSDSIDYDIYLQLISRIENGIRIWHDLQWFGNMTIDNTFTGTPEFYNELTTEEKRTLENWVLTIIYDNSKAEVDLLINANTNFNVVEKNYCIWYNTNLYWGTYPPDSSRVDIGTDYCDVLYEQDPITYNKEYLINDWKSNVYWTIYEIQAIITYINNMY